VRQVSSPLEYPVNLPALMRRRQALKAEFLQRPGGLDLRVALLGGSTTAELREFLHLFLLDAGIRPTFFECEYNQYEAAILHDDAELRAFRPQIAIIHTTAVNARFPALLASDDAVEAQFEEERARFQAMWSKLITDLGCTVLQNNFELPLEQSLGSLDASRPSGRRNFLRRLNDAFARAAHREVRLVLNDIEHLSALVGLERWHDRRYWLSYKLAASHAGLAATAQNLAALVRAIVGKSRKCLVLDLDNTLWGGVIGDDGLTGIRLGKETPEGEAFTAFQRYCLELKTRGVLLAVCSKNEPKMAQEGFSHPDSVLKLTDFAAFKAGWGPKYEALVDMARELNLGLDSFVFFDDNPVERAAVAAQLPMVAVPEIGEDPSKFVDLLDRQLYFEAVSLSSEDTARAGYYASNLNRNLAQATFASYGNFLDSLEMKAEISTFSPVYMERITQLTNKTNQFNLTTRRYTLGELEAIRTDPRSLGLYGRLADKFGDNGLVTVVAGHEEEGELVIDLWLMSCRVLKRDLELAVLDELATRAQARGLVALRGRYAPTAKNALVADHYEKLGFERIARDDEASAWRMVLEGGYQPRNKHIKEISRG
jgi:FkbH-like protein